MKFCKPKPKSILSLDVGTKRIGLAYCDPLCITSNILPAVKRFENNQEIILIRNTIVKNEAKQVNIINQSLESIFEKLSPQGNPYPSPFPLKTK